MNKKEQKELIAFLMELDCEDGVTAKEVGSSNEKPIFAKADYHFDYKYDYSKQKQIIGTIKATDKNKNQSLSYQILPSVHGQLFSINTKTGKLQFNFYELGLRNIANMVLDYKRTFYIQIIAKDNGDFVQSSVANIEVQVTYPKINLTTKELNKFKKLHRLKTKNKTLNEKQRKQFESYCERL